MVRPRGFLVRPGPLLSWIETVRARVPARLDDSEALWDWNLESDRIHFSPRWMALVGCEDHEVGSAPGDWFQRVHPDDHEQLVQEIETARSGDATTFECRYRLRHKDGTYRWMSCRGMVVRDNAGRAIRMTGSQSDVTVDDGDRSAHPASQSPLLRWTACPLDRTGPALQSLSLRVTDHRSRQPTSSATHRPSPTRSSRPSPAVWKRACASRTPWPACGTTISSRAWTATTSRSCSTG